MALYDTNNMRRLHASLTVGSGVGSGLRILSSVGNGEGAGSRVGAEHVNSVWSPVHCSMLPTHAPTTLKIQGSCPVPPQVLSLPDALPRPNS